MSSHRRRRAEQRLLRRLHGGDRDGVDDPDTAAAETIRRALQQLPMELRTVIVLRFYADMSPTDAFITVQERISPEAAGLAPGQPWDETTGFPRRPDEFPPSDSKNVSEVVDCLAEPPVFDNWGFAFNDAGRGFHVLAAIGTQASDQTRGETWAILDSLRFERR